jgi:hypothetical protein
VGEDAGRDRGVDDVLGDDELRRGRVGDSPGDDARRPGGGAVNGVLERAVGFFLAPAPTAREEAAALPPAARAVVLGTAQAAVPLAAALALSLRAGAPPLVAVWGAGDERARRDAASRGAARLAARLSAHELPARARGRLAWLTLPAEPQAAAAAVRRASVIVEGPLVSALAGARPTALDALVAQHDLAIVAADPESPLALAALARLSEAGVAASAHAPLSRGLRRTLVLAGLATRRLDAGKPVAASPGDGP